MNHRAKYRTIGQRSFLSKVIVHTQ